MFVKTMRNITTLFLNNQQKITSIKKTKGKFTMIKAINQKTRVKKQQRTHHRSNSQEITGMQRKNHETSDSRMSNNSKDDCNPGQKNHVAIYLIEGRFWAVLKHYKNRGCILKNHSSNLNEEILTFHVSIVLLWFQSPSLSCLIARNVSSVQHANFFLSSHSSSYPARSPHIPSLPSLPPLSECNPLLSIYALHLPLPSSQPSSLTVITKFWSSFNSVIHRNFNSIGIHRKNLTERLHQTSK